MLLVILTVTAKRKKKGPSYVAKCGNVEVCVYTIRRGQSNEHHCVCHYEAGQRKRRYFSNFELAKTEAGIIAAKISKGDLEAIKLTGPDRQCYVEAMEHLRPTGATLVGAVREYAAATGLLNGCPLLEAVRFYNEHRHGQFRPQKIPEVVAELIRQKENKGRSELYTKDLRYRLNPFAATFKDRNIR